MDLNHQYYAVYDDPYAFNHAQPVLWGCGMSLNYQTTLPYPDYDWLCITGHY